MAILDIVNAAQVLDPMWRDLKVRPDRFVVYMALNSLCNQSLSAANWNSILKRWKSEER